MSRTITPKCCKCGPSFKSNITQCNNLSLTVVTAITMEGGFYFFTVTNNGPFSVNHAAITVTVVFGEPHGVNPGWKFNGDIGVYYIGLMGIGASSTIALGTPVPSGIIAVFGSERPNCNPAAATVDSSIIPSVES